MPNKMLKIAALITVLTLAACSGADSNIPMIPVPESGEF